MSGLSAHRTWALPNARKKRAVSRGPYRHVAAASAWPILTAMMPWLAGHIPLNRSNLSLSNANPGGAGNFGDHMVPLPRHASRPEKLN